MSGAATAETCLKVARLVDECGDMVAKFHVVLTGDHEHMRSLQRELHENHMQWIQEVGSLRESVDLDKLRDR